MLVCQKIETESVMRKTFGQSFQFGQVLFHTGQIYSRFRVFAIQSGSPAVSCFGFGSLAQLLAKSTDVVPGFLNSGVNFQRFAIIVEGFVRFIPQVEREREVEIERRMRRRFADGFVKQFDGFVMDAFGLSNQTEKVENVRISGCGFKNLPIQAFGFVKPSLFVQRQRLLKH